MDQQFFLKVLADTLQTDIALAPDTALATMEEWDSMAAMAFLALADRNFSKKLKLADLRKAQTVNDLYAFLV